MNHETLTWLTFTYSKLKIETLEKGNIQMLKNNFYKVVVQKWFLNGVIKNRCQLLVDLVVTWMTFHYDRKQLACCKIYYHAGIFYVMNMLRTPQ